MPRFRERSRRANCAAAGPLPLDEVRKLIAEAVGPTHFFVKKPLVLEWQFEPCERIAWEIYQDRLLDPAHTRIQRTFEAWSVYCSESGKRSTEPILSAKLDVESRQLHVTRAVYCYAWEGYDAGDNVFLSRETRKWVRELVGTIFIDSLIEADDLRDELICLFFQAVIGSSRLPLQSVEAPLPAFSLGNLAYLYGTVPEQEPARRAPMRSFRELIEGGLHDDLAWLEKAKLLEAVLRSTAACDLGAAAVLFAGRWRALGYSSHQLMALCRTLFNEVGLSPYTGFVDNLLLFLRTLESGGHLCAEQHVDFLGYMLRQNARHLTAYDLVTFHHRGANYPDALLLDTVLNAYLALLETRAELFLPAQRDDVAHGKRKQLRRRALRQAWLLRRMYEGLPVPDAPTSPGENSRVLPAPFERVPEEQIFQPGKRSKRLFEGAPLAFLGQRSRETMQQCVADLQHSEELQELGMAIFLERPFGLGKAPMEPDRTLLLSYETFSCSLAEQRLRYLAKEPTLKVTKEACVSFQNRLRANPQLNGIPIVPSSRAQRPGTVSLQDAARVAEDFIVLRTTGQAVQNLLEQFDFTPLAERFSLDYLTTGQRVLIVSSAATRRGPQDVLDVYDASLQRRLELQIDGSQGYRNRAGREYPLAGLRVLRVWEADRPGKQPKEFVLGDEPITILPRA